MLTHSLNAIDAFVDALWLEDGLSRNTLAAYRRDLTLYAQWLADQQPALALDDTAEHHLQAYFAARHAQTRATSANRRLTVLRRYFHWALRERRITTDPTVRLQAARQPLRVPKTLSQVQVEALLNAPDLGNPLGLRDRTMLELMYASGLRVTELVTLKTFQVGLNEGVLRVMGKVAALYHAADASEDGSRKLDQAFRVGSDAEGTGLAGIRLPLDRAALSVALGRDNVVHLALADRASAERVAVPLRRLLHFLGGREAAVTDGAPDSRPAVTANRV